MASGLSVAGSDSGTKQGGLFLSWIKLALLIIGFVAILIITVIIVVYTPKKEPQCLSDLSAMEVEDAVWEMCVNFPWTDMNHMCAVTSTVATPYVSKNYRLNRHLSVSHYNISLKPDFYELPTSDFLLEGHVDIYITCEEQTNVIMLHNLVDIMTLNVTYANTGDVILISDTSYDEDTEIMELVLERTLNVSEEVVVRVDYTKPITSGRVGVYYGSYWDIYTERMEYYVATDLEPCDARQVFPGLDEPSFKATYETRVWRREGYIALANTALISSTDMGDGWYLDDYGRTPVPMSTYLFSIAVSRFEYISDVAEGGLSTKPIRYLSIPENVRKGYLNYSKSIGGRLMDWLEVKLDEPYIFPKTDMIALPNFTSGGMENWGLITYTPSRLVFNPGEMELLRSHYLTGTVAHEIAHMWFGNLLTCTWWEDLWLQEGFANFYERMAIVNALPELGLETMDILREFDTATAIDRNDNAPPLYNPVETKQQIRGTFNTITYNKGGCMLRMMRELLGHSTFDEAIKKYIQKFKYRNVRHDDLFTTMEEQIATEGLDIGANFTEFMYTWIKQAGFPLITIHRKNESSSTIEITQTELRTEPENPKTQYPSPYENTWIVPLTYTTSASPDYDNPQREWLLKDNRTITLSSALKPQDWVVANVKLEGFYIVNYDRIGWEAIINQLNTDHTVIHPINRARILQDALTFLRMELLSFLDAMRLTEYLTKDEEDYPNQVFHALVVDAERILSDTSAYVYVRMYVRRWAEAHYARLGWDNQDSDSLGQKYLRRMVKEEACKLGVPACVQEASSRFAAWMADPSTHLIPDEKETILCTGVHHGGEEAWTFLLNYVLNTNKLFYRALGCTDLPWLLSSYLDLLLQPPETVPENLEHFRRYGFNQLTQHPVGRSLVWHKLEEGPWGEWAQMYEDDVLSTLRLYATSKAQIERITKIYERDFPAQVDNREALSPGVEAQIKWRQENLESITDWLKAVVT